MWVVFDMLYKACNEWAIEYISRMFRLEIVLKLNRCGSTIR